MAGVDNTSGVTSSQIISSTSKTSNTKQSNMLNMQDFLSLLVAEMQNLKAFKCRDAVPGSA